MDILIHADKSTIHICLQKTYTHQPLCPLQFLCPLILQRQCYQIPYKTSPHPMLPNTYKKNWTQSTQPPYLQNGQPPDRVKCIMDSVKQKLEKPNKLTLKQFNRQLKATTLSLTESFPFHPTIAKKIKKSLASHDIKRSKSQVQQGLPYGTYSPKRRLYLLLTSLPTSFMKFLVMTALPPTMDRRTDP